LVKGRTRGRRKRIQHPVAPCPSESTMSQYTATTSDRERVRGEALLARAAEQSRHEISKLALELLQQRRHAQHVVNVENKQRTMAIVEEKFSTAAAELAGRHGKEATDLEDAKFVLFAEFDTRRVAWASATTAHDPQLAEEASKHAALIETLMANKLREDNEAQQTLQTSIPSLRQDYGCVLSPTETKS